MIICFGSVHTSSVFDSINSLIISIIVVFPLTIYGDHTKEDIMKNLSDINEFLDKRFLLELSNNE